MHKLNTIYLYTFTFTRTGELKTSCQKQVSGWRAREEEMEEEGLVEPKETSSKCKISPQSKNLKKYTKMHCGISNERYKTTALPPKITHSVHVLSVSN